MRKLFFILSIIFIYLPLNGQKASFYQDKSVNLNTYTSFYLLNTPIDAHDLSGAYLNKSIFNDNEYMYFATYYELSLKNIVVVDGENMINCFHVKPYISNKFDHLPTPLSYKIPKIKSNTLVIDLVDASTKTLVWRGWINLDKIKTKDQRLKITNGIHLITKLLQFEGVEMPG